MVISLTLCLMAIMHKITRLLWKTLKYAFLIVILLLVFVLIAINTEGFQTYAAQKATNYLSKELGVTIKIEKVAFAFFRTAELQNVFVEDKNKDTLLYGKQIDVAISGFSFNEKTLTLNSVELKDINMKLIKSKNSDDFNFQFLADYFSSKDTISSSSNWKIGYGDVKLNNVNFTYRNDNYNTTVSENMNYDNISVKNAYGLIKDFHVINEEMYATIIGLKAKEQCGMVLSKLNCLAKVSYKELECRDLYLETPNSKIIGKLAFNYKQWTDYRDFIDKVQLYAWLEDSTRVGFKDIAYFANELNGLDKSILLNGKITGYISDLKGEDITLLFEDNTQFIGDVSLKGLPNIRSTYLSFDVTKLSTSKNDIEKIPSYPFTKNEFLKLPSDISKFGIINYKGKFNGFITDFKSYGAFKTDLGSVTTDIAMQIDTVKNIVKYQGKINSEKFDLGKLIGDSKLGAVSLNSKIEGKGLTLKDLNTRLNGKINSIAYNGYNYQDINIDGEIKNKIFKGDLLSKDKYADFDFKGSVDFTGKMPQIDFISTVNRINLKKLNFVTSEKEGGDLSSQLLINLKGDNIDNLTGLIYFDNTIYKTEEREFKVNTFNLSLEQETPEKKIKLSSNIMDMIVEGPYKITSLEPSIHQFLNAYYPAFVSKLKTKTVYKDALKFKLTVKKFNTFRDYFFNGDFMISPGSVFNGDFDASKNLFNLNSTSDSIRYKTVKFYNNKIESYSQNNKVNLVLKSQNIQLTDSIQLKNYFMYVVSKDNNTKYNLEWDNKETPKNAGRLMGKLVFDNKTATLNFEKIFLTTRDSTWTLVEANPTTIDSSGYWVVNPLRFISADQMINIQGALSSRPKDKLDFNLKNFDLAQLSPFFANAKLKVNGTVNGTLSLHNTLKELAFSTDLYFNKLKLNGKDLGDGELKTEYNNPDKYIYVDGYTSLGFENILGEKLKNLSFSGYYYLNKKEESIDINFEANPVNLTLLNPYLAGIITLNKALVTGKGKVTGSAEKPMINGKFKTNKCELKVDFTNVVYDLTGDVEILPDQIRFEDILVADNINKKSTYPGSINGNIFHNSFRNMRIDFDINFKNMLVLNLPPKEGEAFYGKAFATGKTGIYGLLDNVKLEIDVKTEKGTVFVIPLDGPAEVSDNNFIRFVSKDTIKSKRIEKNSGFSLEMNLAATPDAEAQIIFDAKSGDVIKARGKGDLKLNINNKGKFDMFGEYIISSGDYLFTLENFITKRFEIQKGSSINWSGSPYNADIDIVANYKQRASIAPLFPLDQNVPKTRYPVTSKLMMKNRLLTPDITFGIDLPTIDENTRSRIKATMLDEAELNRQVFSLLLLKTFVTPLQYSGAGGISAGSALAANGSEMLSNRLSGWLSGLTKQVDIGVNYRPGDQVSNDELAVALSKQLLNNRLSVDGNLGVNSNSNSSNKNSSGIIGDVNAEYKLTDDGRYRVKGFNRSNDNTQMSTSGGPFTQGVGIFYREEFDSWAELYDRYLRKLKSLPKKKSLAVETPEGVTK